MVNKTGDMIIKTHDSNGSIELDAKNGITVFKHNTNELAQVNSNGINVVAGKAFTINNQTVLNASTLGSGVTNSSLTSVGTLNSGSISSGFGNINVGNSTIQSSGTVSGGTVTDGTAVMSSGSLSNVTNISVESSSPNVTIKSTDSGDGPAKLTMVGDNGGDAGDSYQFVSQYGNFKLASDHSSKNSFNDTIMTITGSNSASNREVAITGKLRASTINMNDNDSIQLGTSGDLILKHDGSNSFINNSTGDLNISTTNSGGNVTIGHSTSEVTIGDNLNVTGNTVINGNLNVIGEFTQTNTTTHVVQDRLIKIGDGNTGTATDLGIVFTRGNGSATNKANKSLLYHEAGNTFAFTNTNEEDGTTSGNVSIDDYANLRVGALVADDESTFTQGMTVGGNITLPDTNSMITHSGSGKLIIDSQTGHVELVQLNLMAQL